MRLPSYKLTYFLPLFSVLGLAIIFFNMSPLEAGAGGILAVFFLIYLFWASVFFMMLHAGIGLVSRLLSRQRNFNIREWQVGVRKSYYIASVIAFAPVLLLGMQSVGQLQFRDVLLVAALLSLVTFYIVKRT